MRIANPQTAAASVSLLLNPKPQTSNSKPHCNESRIRKQLRQAFLYSRASCAAAVVPDPLVSARLCAGVKSHTTNTTCAVLYYFCHSTKTTLAHCARVVRSETREMLPVLPASVSACNLQSLRPRRRGGGKHKRQERRKRGGGGAEVRGPEGDTSDRELTMPPTCQSCRRSTRTRTPR